MKVFYEEKFRGGHMEFTKMQGNGNDFIIIDDRENRYRDYGNMALKMCDRHFGIGGDGILVVKNSSSCDSMMLVYNSDGSQAEMCGNGIRCFAKYLFDRGIVKKENINIETLSGVKTVKIESKGGLVCSIKVNMGKPDFSPDMIPAVIPGDRIVNIPVCINSENFSITSMLMGVPHTVVFTENISSSEAERTGRVISECSLFPRKTNVNFVNVISRDEISVKTLERGAGLTLACGTGACASVVACVLNGKTEKKVLVHLSGGDLNVELADDGNVYMSGSAAEVFKGEYVSLA